MFMKGTGMLACEKSSLSNFSNIMLQMYRNTCNFSNKMLQNVANVQKYWTSSDFLYPQNTKPEKLTSSVREASVSRCFFFKF